jgi:hypothetical protein
MVLMICGDGDVVVFTCVAAVDGRGDVLMGEFVTGAGEGATEGDLDHPAGVEDTVGPAVNFAVTSLGCEEVGCIVGRAMKRPKRLVDNKTI